MYLNGIQSYRKTNVITSDPGRLVLMCYEGAIDNLLIAKRNYAEEKYEGKCQAIQKTQDIINELLCSLDLEKGGSIARNLESLYNYMTRKIIHSDINRDMAAIDEVIGMLKELLSAWKEVLAKPNIEIQQEAAGFHDDRFKQASRYAGI